MLEKLIDKKIRGKYYSQLEIARVIYIELGKVLSFSTDYMHNYHYDIFQKVNYKTYNQNQVVCRIWAQLYEQLLKKYGIKCRIVASGHTYVEFWIDGILWIADATYGAYTDLSRIKNGDDTDYFGISVTQIKSNQPSINYAKTKPILEQVDKKIGYALEKDKLKKLKNCLMKIKNNNFDIERETGIKCHSVGGKVLLKLEYLFQMLDVMNNGYYEAKDYVYEMEKYILTKEEMKLVKGTELIRINKKNRVDKVQVISVNLSNGQYSYYLLSPNLKIQKVSERNIICLSILGYGIGEKAIPGINYPNHFIESRRSKQGSIFKKMKLFKDFPYFKNYDVIQARSLQ